MGADLYIDNEAYSALNDALQRMLDGEQNREEVTELNTAFHDSPDYFRDPYNGLCVMWTLNISWWDDVIPMLDTEGCLSGEPLRQLYKKIEASVQILPTLEMLRENHVMVDENQTVEMWQEFLLDKREKLCSFLQRAIQNDSKVVCSL